MKLKLSLFFITVISLVGCGTTQTKLEISPTGLQQIVSHTADIVIIPNIKSWQQSSKVFHGSVQQFCQAPNTPKLKQLQADWKQLSLKWNQTIMFDFGPLRDNLFSAKVNFVEPMRQRGKNYDSTVRSRLNQRLNDTKKLDRAYFAKLNFNLVGISALEQMVFSDFITKKTDSKAIVTNYRNNTRSCALLIGISELNLDNANYVMTGWQKSPSANTISKKSGDMPAGSSYRDLFASGRLMNGEKSLTKLVFSMQDYLRYIKQRKLDGRLDAIYSGMTFKNMEAGLEAIESVFTAKETALSLQKYLQVSGKQKVADAFLNTLNIAKKQAQAKDREAMKPTYSKLIKMLEKDIPKGLGVDFGMNFTDGD